MIVDCHAHVFENWQGACGHPSVDVHLKYIQKNVTRPAARTFRLRDGATATPEMLFWPDDNTWAGLADVDFRVGPYGRLQFTKDGEDYAVQYMPVGILELRQQCERHRTHDQRGLRSIKAPDGWGVQGR